VIHLSSFFFRDMEYKKIEETYLNDFLTVWNEEFGKYYPLTQFLIHRNILNCKNVDHEASTMIYDEHIFVGIIIGKVWNESFEVLGYQDLAWISILYVNPNYRQGGIGSSLIKHAEDVFYAKQKQTIVLGKDPNNFFPGIPNEFHQYYQWFEKRGYQLLRDTYDLMRTVDDCSSLVVLPNISYEILFLNKDYFASTLEFMHNNFPGRWTYELSNYIEQGGTGKEYLILLDNNHVIGFCRINDNNTQIINYNMTWSALFDIPSGIGPLGIDQNYRKLHLGYYIVGYATNQLIQKKVSNIVIDWTSLTSFYAKFGFHIWKTYRYAQKTIKY
jgi:GNAT superfamily N-acetyltransferase/predicted GNAT family N-acyltransferase